MKQETKELIKFIKKALEQDLHHLALLPGPEGLEKYSSHKLLKEKADAFLDSLEDFENQLKHGGYIPDMNKIPCKDGDKIRVVEPESDKNHSPEFKKGDIYILHWDPLWHEFYFQDIKTKSDYFFSYEDKFEKV